MRFEQELVSRKDYLKNKKRQQRRSLLGNVNKKTWFLLAFIIVISIYVAYQFYVYNTKHRLIQTLPDEISSMKEYKIYYVSQTYSYDGKNSLKSMTTTSNEKETIDEGLGISQINVKNNYVYGIIDGKLIKINTNGKENEVEEIVSDNVKGYSIYNDEIFVYLNGKDVETGIYSVGKKNKLIKIIPEEVLQMLVDKDNIYIVNKDKNIVKYDKDGKNQQTLITDKSAASIIQNDKYIYFVNTKDGNKLYRVNKKGGKSEAITNSATLVTTIKGMNGASYMDIYEDTVYYINTKDNNKLYKTVVGSKEDVKLLDDNIKILDIIDGTIFYIINGDIGVYRYDISSSVTSQVTSARVVEFKAEQ